MGRLRSVAATLLLLVLAAACGSTDTGGGQGTETPSSITVYSGREKDLVEPLFAKFTEATGIRVEARYGDSAELAAQILDEGDNSPADVFFAQDGGALGAVAAEGRFVKLPETTLAKVDAGYRGDGGEWVGISGRARTVVYNTQALKEAGLPKSMEGFTAATWKGKIGWAPTNASFQAFVTAMRKLRGDEATRAWLRGIKANDPQEYPKNTAIVEAVGAGEIQVGFVNHYYLLRIKKENPNIAAANHFMRNGDAGSLVNVAGAGVLKSSEKQSAAQRFVDYLLSEEGQTYFKSETFEYPLVASVTADAQLPALSSLQPPKLDLSQLADLEATLTMLREEGIL